jgi:hypothetical protein
MRGKDEGGRMRDESEGKKQKMASAVLSGMPPKISGGT